MSLPIQREGDDLRFWKGYETKPYEHGSRLRRYPVLNQLATDDSDHQGAERVSNKLEGGLVSSLCDRKNPTMGHC